MEPDPKLDKHLGISENALSLFFYDHDVMPCCMNERKYNCGPQGGSCINITCFHCGHPWKVNFRTKFIQDIETDIPTPETH